MSPAFTPPPALTAAALAGYAAAYGASVRRLDLSLAEAPAPADLIYLTHGDTQAFAPPPRSAADFRAAVADSAEAYTPYRGSASLRSALAPRLASLLGRPVDADTELIVTPGTQGALFAALSALVSPGDTVLLPDPEYFMSERIVSYLGGVPARIAIEQNEQGFLTLRDPEVAAVSRPRLLLLSHPNNPTGGVYQMEALAALADFAVARDLIVVVDQLYCRLLFTGTKYGHLCTYPGMRERTITLLGPSKTESMSGYRVGVAVGPKPAIDTMEHVLAMTSLRAAGYAQQAMRHWLDGDEDWLGERIAAHEDLRDLLVGRLRTIPGVSVAAPAGSSYAFPLVAGTRWGRQAGPIGSTARHGPSWGRANDHMIAVALKQAGVLVNPGYQFGPAGRGRFRINFSQDKDRLLTAIDRIATALGQ